MRKVFISTTYYMIFLALFGCGVGHDSVSSNSDGYTPRPESVIDGERSGNRALVGVQVSRKSATGLALADEAASAYSMTIVCDSNIDSAGGNAGELVVTNATGNLRLYIKDQCTSTLTSVTVDGTAYTGSSDTTQGNVATFTDGGSPAKSLRVTSTDILDGSEIASGDAILYEFEVFDALADQTLAQNDVENSDDTSRTVEGVNAPNYTIDSITFSDVTADGSAVLQINLACGASYVADTSCDGQAITDMDYWLVDASDSDGVGGAGIDFSDGVTYTELETLGAGTSGIDAKVDITAADDDGTSGGLQIAAEGPDSMFDHLDLIFVVKYIDPNGDGNSYLFFDININDLTQ